MRADVNKWKKGLKKETFRRMSGGETRLTREIQEEKKVWRTGKKGIKEEWRTKNLSVEGKEGRNDGPDQLLRRWQD